MRQLENPLSSFFAVGFIESFFRLSRILPFSRSTWSLALGWATETYLMSMVLRSQKSQKVSDVKFDPKSIMMVLGELNRYSMSQMKSTTLSALCVVTGL